MKSSKEHIELAERAASEAFNNYGGMAENYREVAKLELEIARAVHLYESPPVTSGYDTTLAEQET